MARTEQVVLVDDLDGSDADQTVRFALEGTSYEIDLSAANAVALREAMAPWVGHARRTSAHSERPGRNTPAATGR